MKKYFPWIISSVLIIALGVVVFLLIKTNNEKQALGSTMDSFTNSTIATQVAEYQTNQNTIAALETTQAELQSRINELQIQLLNEQTKYGALVTENSHVVGILYCADKEKFTPDYASNLAMSIALKAFESSITGLSIQDASWEVIWSGANTSIHDVYIYKNNKRLKVPYVVFFTEQGMNLKKGVFDVTNQCWLDLE
jgi:hypothetical protein